jgi:hypothetical protein
MFDPYGGMIDQKLIHNMEERESKKKKIASS